MMSARVDGLEKRMERVEVKLSSIEVLLAEIKGQPIADAEGVRLVCCPGRNWGAQGRCSTP